MNRIHTVPKGKMLIVREESEGDFHHCPPALPPILPSSPHRYCHILLNTSLVSNSLLPLCSSGCCSSGRARGSPAPRCPQSPRVLPIVMLCVQSCPAAALGEEGAGGEQGLSGVPAVGRAPAELRVPRSWWGEGGRNEKAV